MLGSLWVLVGLVLLVAGGELLVRGASGLATAWRMPQAVVGLTVVAIGTSMPELVVSVLAAWRGDAGVAVGNVVGSNVFNIAAILGLVALVSPIAVRAAVFRLEWPVAFGSAVLLWLLCRDGRIDLLEGAVLVGIIVAFLALLALMPGPTAEVVVEPLPTLSLGKVGAAAWVLNSGGVLLGIGLLAGGADAFVRGAVELATLAGVSSTVIGLTVVSVGTSLPELVASLAAVRQRNHEVAVGNVLGSNIFNALGIVGVTALVAPLPVEPELVARDLPLMVGVTAVLLPILWTSRQVSRVEGGLLLVGYVAYVIVLIWS